MEARQYWYSTKGINGKDIVIIGVIVGGVCALIRPIETDRSIGQKTICISRLKTLSVANLMYSFDQGERFCPISDPDSQRPWFGLVSKYVPSGFENLCPLDQKDSVSYGINAIASFDPATAQIAPAAKFPPMSAYKHPEETVFLCEAGAEDNLLTQRKGSYKVLPPDDHIAMSYEARPILRHYPKTVLSFMDGHAKSMAAEEFYVGKKPADFSWCSDRSDAKSCRSATVN